MTVLNLVLAPSPILNKMANHIKIIDKSIQKLSNNMFDTMYKYNGVGLAAPQIGESLQILVVDCSKTDKKFNPKTIINPKIILVSDNIKTDEEGCLSFPNQFYKINRPDFIEVEYLDIDGKKKINKFTGFEAVCVQHEIDHLRGILFVDHMSKLRKNIILRKMKKYKKRRSQNI